MSALVSSEIFRLFVNTLAPDHKYSRRYMQNFLQQLQTPISQKGMAFFWIFYCISEMCLGFRTFWKKKEEYPSLKLLQKLLHPKEMFA